ncbi:MAG: type II secretion system protein [Pseudomonadota bacterium]
MLRGTARRRRRSDGFTLTELAVVLAIVALLLGSLMYTLAAQTDQRNFEETRRRLEQARELLLGFAIVNGRLPCPARSAATATPATVPGDEVRDPATGACVGDAVTDYYGGTSAGATRGLLPARTIGYPVVDASGLAVDAWGNRIRYAVASLITGCSGSSLTPHFTHAANLRANGISCQPNDLVVCKSATGITPAACGGAANQIMSQNLVVAILFSTGKNGATGGTGPDEAANLNGDRVFVWHTPTPSTAPNGEFDDQMLWITVGELYGRMIAAGVLP